LELYINFLRESFTNSDKFLKTGFLTIQNWIDNIILRKETGNDNIFINPSFTSVPVVAHVSDNIATYLQGQTNVFLVLPLILPYLRLIFRLLYEKV
jgi:ATP-binding cassette, subfamily A (ABC1), member 3